MYPNRGTGTPKWGQKSVFKNEKNHVWQKSWPVEIQPSPQISFLSMYLHERGVVSFYKIVKEGSLKKTGLQGKTLINTCSKYTENAARAC